MVVALETNTTQSSRTLTIKLTTEVRVPAQTAANTLDWNATADLCGPDLPDS
jgi:hypothetical protein